MLETNLVERRGDEPHTDTEQSTEVDLNFLKEKTYMESESEKKTIMADSVELSSTVMKVNKSVEQIDDKPPQDGTGNCNDELVSCSNKDDNKSVEQKDNQPRDDDTQKRAASHAATIETRLESAPEKQKPIEGGSSSTELISLNKVYNLSESDSCILVEREVEIILISDDDNDEPMITDVNIEKHNVQQQPKYIGNKLQSPHTVNNNLISKQSPNTVSSLQSGLTATPNNDIKSLTKYNVELKKAIRMARDTQKDLEVKIAAGCVQNKPDFKTVFLPPDSLLAPHQETMMKKLTRNQRRKISKKRKRLKGYTNQQGEAKKPRLETDVSAEINQKSTSSKTVLNTASIRAQYERFQRSSSSTTAPATATSCQVNLPLQQSNKMGTQPNIQSQCVQAATKTSTHAVTPCKIAISCVNYPAQKLSGESIQTLKKNILEEVDKVEYPNANLGFINSTIKDGWLSLTCNNKETRNWLTKIIHKLQQFPPDSLKTFSETEMANSLHMVHISMSKDDVLPPNQLLLRLMKQNAGLETNKWKVVTVVRESNGDETTSFSIDEQSKQKILARKSKLFLNFSQIQVRLDVRGESMQSNSQSQHHTNRRNDIPETENDNNNNKNHNNNYKNPFRQNIAQIEPFFCDSSTPTLTNPYNPFNINTNQDVPMCTNSNAVNLNGSDTVQPLFPSSGNSAELNLFSSMNCFF